MKKVLSIALVAMMMLSVLVIAVAAAEATQDGTTYELIQPTDISASWQGIDDEHEVKVVPQGGCDMSALIDGDLVRNASGFSTKGIVLLQNAWIPANGTQGTNPADQPDEEIPTFSFDLDLGAKKKFDSAYIGIYHEIASCIAIPGDKAVMVETSADGKTWVSVGDGKFFFNSAVGDYNGAGDQGIDECIVYLGKEVESRYVRLTFTFMKVPETGYWRNYTNVYEWCGLTELGVAKYKSGVKPGKIDESEAQADPTKVEGLWMCDDDTEISIFEFVDNHGQKSVNIKTYKASDFKADALSAVPTADEDFSYSVLATHLTLTDKKGNVEKMEAILGEDGDLMLEVDGDSLLLTPFTWPKPAEPSEEPSEDEPSEEPSEDEPSEEPSEDEPSEEPSEAESVEESKAEESKAEESAAESKAEESKAQESEGGLSTGAIVGIVVAAVAVIGGGAAAAVILGKKKK